MTSRAFNHINLQIFHHYKINDNWTFELGNEFQRSMDTINDEELRPNDGDRNMQTNIASTMYMKGNIKGVEIRAGRWYDYDVYGFALDGTVTGA